MIRLYVVYSAGLRSPVLYIVGLNVNDKIFCKFVEKYFILGLLFEVVVGLFNL